MDGSTTRDSVSSDLFVDAEEEKVPFEAAMDVVRLLTNYQCLRQ